MWTKQSHLQPQPRGTARAAKLCWDLLLYRQVGSSQLPAPALPSGTAPIWVWRVFMEPAVHCSELAVCTPPSCVLPCSGFTPVSLQKGPWQPKDLQITSMCLHREITKRALAAPHAFSPLICLLACMRTHIHPQPPKVTLCRIPQEIMLLLRIKTLRRAESVASAGISSVPVTSLGTRLGWTKV